MNCTYIQNHVIDIVEQSLSDSETTGVREHMCGCTTCADTVAAFRTTWESLESPAAYRPNYGFVSSVLERRSRNPLAWIIPRPQALWRPAFSAALIACGVWLGSLLGTPAANNSLAQQDLTYYTVFSEYPDGQVSDIYVELSESEQEFIQ